MTYRLLLALTVTFAVIVGFVGLLVSTANAGEPPVVDEGPAYASLYQGKSITWWAKKAHQARKDANARRATIHRLKKTIRYSASIEECVKLATIAYPALNLSRAWRIVGGESQGNPNARNKKAVWNGEHALGLWQFLQSTFNSTPYGKAGMSIWSPCASSLAAGWMHQNGRGGEWAGY